MSTYISTHLSPLCYTEESGLSSLCYSEESPASPFCSGPIPVVSQGFLCCHLSSLVLDHFVFLWTLSGISKVKLTLASHHIPTTAHFSLPILHAPQKTPLHSSLSHLVQIASGLHIATSSGSSLAFILSSVWLLLCETSPFVLFSMWTTQVSQLRYHSLRSLFLTKLSKKLLPHSLISVCVSTPIIHLCTFFHMRLVSRRPRTLSYSKLCLSCLAQ